MIKIIWLSIAVLVFAGCGSERSSIPAQNVNTVLADSLATKETVALFTNLSTFSKDRVLFGHQETTAYGVGWKNNGSGNRSDVKDVCGDFPAVYGWDIGNIRQVMNNDSVPFVQMKELMKQAFLRGGINTVSNHMTNPATNADAFAEPPPISNILPGGDYHQQFVRDLDLIADFMKDLKVADDSGIPKMLRPIIHWLGQFTGRDSLYVPVIFRPYHEHNGDWFWWGKGAATEEEFIQLWRFTVDYLRNEKNVHNLIYAISPDRSRMGPIVSRDMYLYGYPGDEYVDIIGLDNYFDLGSHWNRAPLEEQAVSLINTLELIVQLAAERGKVAALTETGLGNLHLEGWWTDMALRGIKYNEQTSRIAYLLVWRNASVSHFHVPYPGHYSVADFLTFYSDSLTIFESELPDMYHHQ
jgi:mannan endo-1,4-beta-mannosidase